MQQSSSFPHQEGESFADELKRPPYVIEFERVVANDTTLLDLTGSYQGAVAVA